MLKEKHLPAIETARRRLQGLVYLYEMTFTRLAGKEAWNEFDYREYNAARRILKRLSNEYHDAFATLPLSDEQLPE